MSLSHRSSETLENTYPTLSEIVDPFWIRYIKSREDTYVIDDDFDEYSIEDVLPELDPVGDHL